MGKEQLLIEQFSEMAKQAGAEVVSTESVGAAVSYMSTRVSGPMLVPSFATGGRFKLRSVLKKAGVDVVTEHLRECGEQAEGGVTGVNFAIADTGTLVLESTAEDVRLATTLPEKQFALLDPDKIVADGLEAVAPLRRLHEKTSQNFVAYVTGPSRTADIERVLTIGVHGPKELHILLVPGLSEDFGEM